MARKDSGLGGHVSRISTALQKDQVGEALLDWWRQICEPSSFVACAVAARSNVADHQAKTAKILPILRGDCADADALAEKLGPLADAAPLAMLSALDAYLFECGGRFWEPKRLRRGSDEYWLALRSRLGVKTPRHMAADESRDFFTPHFSIVRHRLPEQCFPQGGEILYTSLDSSRAYRDDTARGMLERKALVACLGAFCDAIGFVPEPSENWRADNVADEILRSQNVLELMERARQAKADVVVFPELTMPKGCVETLRKWLMRESHSLSWVVAGSFHVQDGGRCFNRSLVLDGQGNEILSWDKLLPFHKPAHGKHPEIRENIERGTQVRLLATPLGLISTPICRDLGEETDGVRLPWMQIPVDFLFVPSMGYETTLSAHKSMASKLFRHGVVTLVANQDPDCREKHRGFACCAAQPGSQQASISEVEILVIPLDL